MPNLPEGVAPESATAQALEALQKGGDVIADDNTPQFDGEDVVEKATPEPEKPAVKEEDKKPEETKVEDPKPNRDVGYVPAWKMKVAESQKEATEKKLAEAQAEIQRLSQKPDLTKSDKADLSDPVKTIAEKHGLDLELVRDLAALNGGAVPKEITEKLKELDKLKEESNKTFQENAYSKEFEKDVLPMLKAENPDISDSALSQIKDKLKTYAFSEEYGKVSLAKIFKAEKDDLGIPAPVQKKKATESARSGAIRGAETIDFDNLTEEEFLALPDDKKVEATSYLRNKNRK